MTIRVSKTLRREHPEGYRYPRFQTARPVSDDQYVALVEYAIGTLKSNTLCEAFPDFVSALPPNHERLSAFDIAAYADFHCFLTHMGRPPTGVVE